MPRLSALVAELKIDNKANRTLITTIVIRIVSQLVESHEFTILQVLNKFVPAQNSA